MRPIPRWLLLGLWPEMNRPEPQPCPHCGQGWLWPLSPQLWFCPTCHWLWPEEEPRAQKLSLPLVWPSPNGHGPVAVPYAVRRYYDAYGFEVLRKEER